MTKPRSIRAVPPLEQLVDAMSRGLAIKNRDIAIRHLPARHISKNTLAKVPSNAHRLHPMSLHRLAEFGLCNACPLESLAWGFQLPYEVVDALIKTLSSYNYKQIRQTRNRRKVRGGDKPVYKLPSPPASPDDIQAMDRFWNGLIKTVEFRALSRVLAGRSAHANSYSQLRTRVIRRGLQAFLNYGRAYSHAVSFQIGGMDRAAEYVRMLSTVLSESDVLLRVRPLVGTSTIAVISDLRGKLGMHLMQIEWGLPVARQMMGWPLGSISVAPSATMTGNNNANGVSYGAWFAQYFAAILFATAEPRRDESGMCAQ